MQTNIILTYTYTHAQHHTGPFLTLQKGTPELQTTGKVYEISITTTDFLGISSLLVLVRVQKHSTPMISLSFFPPAPLTIVRTEAAVIKAVAAFPGCYVNESELVFDWVQLAGKLYVCMYDCLCIHYE